MDSFFPTRERRAWLLRAAWLGFIAAAWGLAACGFPTPNKPPAEIDDYCVENPGECPPCESEDQCIVSGNACIDSPPDCRHKDAEVGYPSLGCNREHYEMPPDSACDCVDSTCRADR